MTTSDIANIFGTNTSLNKDKKFKSAVTTITYSDFVASHIADNICKVEILKI